MRQKANVLIISIIAILILVVSFIFAINYSKESVRRFYDSGYIISNLYEEGSNNVNKLYFETDTTYRQTKNKTYTFTNSEGKKVDVSEESFVHYSNGSIMSLKKGVAIDLNDIESNLISYYNIFEGSVLTKKNEVYEIANLDDTITFSKLLYKISNNKYLIGATKIVVSFADDQTVDMDKYAEIEYVNENVIRIYNDKVNYQTIASNLYLMVDDIKIDLEYKTISKNNIEHLTMADMVINADDNIEILPEREDVLTPGETDTSNNNGVNNNQGNDNVGEQIDPELQEGLDNIISTLPEGEKIEEKEEIIQPKFKVDNLDVTTLGFENLSLSFEDESSVLYGNRIVEILENATGKVVATLDEWEEGMLNYTVNSYLALKPNTAYTLNVSGQYKIEDAIYDRTFISKIFRTLDIGLDIVDDYKTEDTLSFAVYRNSYSEVSGFSYNITDEKGNVIVDDTKANFSSSDKLVVTEIEKFNSNTKYIFTIKGIQYGNDLFSTVAYQELEITHETETLKSNPFAISNVKLSGTVDSIKNQVTFTVDGINDKNSGIKNYTYNVYNSVGEIKKTIVKDDSKPLTVSFEEFDNEENIYYNVAINFDDNEKTIMFLSQDSEPINLSGTSYPKIVDFVKDTSDLNSEKLAGEILIDDNENYIASNGISTYKVDIKRKTNSSLGGTEQYVGTVQIKTSKNQTDVDGSIEIETPNTATSQYSLSVYFEGLYPNTEYILYVYLFTEGRYIYLGYDTAKTETSQPVYLDVTLDRDLSEKNAVFDFKVSINADKKNISLEYLKQLTFDLYSCSKTNTSECKKTNYSATLPRSQNVGDYDELYKFIYNNKIVDLDSFHFGFSLLDGYNPEYDYKVVITARSNRYEIPVMLKVNDTQTETNEFLVEFNNVSPELTISAKEILNSETEDGPDIKFADETIVGYKFEINTVENPMRNNIENVYYSIETGLYDEENDTCNIEDYDEESANIKKLDLANLSDMEEIIYFGKDNALTRGVHYCMVYKGDYIGNDGNETETLPKFLHFFAPKQSAEIAGYIKKYDGNSLIFDLEIDDPDTVLQSIKLSDGSKTITATKTKDNEYEFNNIEPKNYVLRITQNIGNGNRSHKIYDVNLDDIINMDSNEDEIKVKVDTNSPGRIILIVPYSDSVDTDIDAEETLVKTENKVLNGKLNRIAGIGIEKDGSIHYFKLNNSNEGYLYTDIGLTNIDGNYGKIEDGILTLNNIYILYDSGKIVDYRDNINSQYFFMKSKNEGLNNNYFNKSKKDFMSISEQSIFNINEFTADEKFKNYTFNKSSDVALLSNKFNSSNTENSSIGISLNIINQFSKLVNFNEVLKSPKVTLYDMNDAPITKDNVIKIKDVLSTSEIRTTYTSTGAEVSFDIENQNINPDTNLIVKLEENGITKQKGITYSCNSDVCDWNKISFGENESDKITNILTSGKTITILFDKINENTVSYKYSLEFSIGNTEEYMATYNVFTKKNNENIEITSLKKLYLNSYDVKASYDKWEWTNENYEDLVFTKNINYSFSVNQSKYKLKSGEKIVYKIMAQKTPDGNETCIVGKNESLEITENSGMVDLYENSLSDGTYNIIFRPELINESNQHIVLDDVVFEGVRIINTNPEFSVIKTIDPIFSFQMDDWAGMLRACENYTHSSEDVIKFIGLGAEEYYNKNKKKVVYLELYSISADKKEKFLGFIPIPFTVNSSRIDLTNYFSNKKLKSGTYNFKIQYCLVGNEEIQTWTREPIQINNPNSFRTDVIKLSDTIVLILKNPDEVIKDSVQRITYQYKTLTNENYINKTLSNIDSDINNDIVYQANINEDGTTDYFLELPIGGILTSQITKFEIYFYESDGTLIKKRIVG